MSHQKILAMLAGHDAQNPMAFDDLVKAGGLQPGTLNMILLDMYNSSPNPINYATITRGGKTQTVYWPTGVIALHPGPQGIMINPQKKFPPLPASTRSIPAAKAPAKSAPVASPTPCSYPPAAHQNTAKSTAKVQPNTSINQKEQAMTSPKPSALRAWLLEQITNKPGIKKRDLIDAALKKFPEEDEKHVAKTLENMQHVGKKIRAEGDFRNRTYFPNKPAAAAAAASPTVAKQEVPTVKPAVAEAVPVAELIKRAHDKHAGVKEDDAFEIMLSDDNHLHVTLGGDMFMLKPGQFLRLHRFMARIDQPKPTLLGRLFGRA